jgi:hypothetical protein
VSSVVVHQHKRVGARLSDCERRVRLESAKRLHYANAGEDLHASRGMPRCVKLAKAPIHVTVA